MTPAGLMCRRETEEIFRCAASIRRTVALSDRPTRPAPRSPRKPCVDLQMYGLLGFPGFLKESCLPARPRARMLFTSMQQCRFAYKVLSDGRPTWCLHGSFRTASCGAENVVTTSLYTPL
jgi:hypothetical protein